MSLVVCRGSQRDIGMPLVVCRGLTLLCLYCLFVTPLKTTRDIIVSRCDPLQTTRDIILSLCEAPTNN
jgi:hypothetical protein